MSEPRKPKFVVLPAELVFDHELPAHLHRLYEKLLALAWIHDYEWLDYGIDDVAQCLNMEPQTLSRYVRHLAERGYVTREREGSHSWRTRFHVRWSVRQRTAHIHIQQQRETDHTQQQRGQPNSVGSTTGPTRTGHEDGEDDVDSKAQRLQRQHRQSYRALCAIGVLPAVALDLAQSSDPDRLDGWVEYAIVHEERLCNPAGLVVRMLRSRKAAPDLTPKDVGVLERKLRMWELRGWKVWEE